MSFEKILNQAEEAAAVCCADCANPEAQYGLKRLFNEIMAQLAAPRGQEDDSEQEDMTNNDCIISGVYFHGNKTTITWGDNFHTTVGWMEDGCLPYSRLVGFAMCVLKAVMEDPEHGLTYMEVIKRLYPSVLFEPECVKQDITDMRNDGEINDEEQQWLLKRMNKIEEVYRVYAANGHSAKSAVREAIWFKLEEKRYCCQASLIKNL